MDQIRRSSYPTLTLLSLQPTENESEKEGWLNRKPWFYHLDEGAPLYKYNSVATECRVSFNLFHCLFETLGDMVSELMKECDYRDEAQF